MQSVLLNISSLKNFISDKFNEVVFDEENHRYKVNEDDYISVTTLIKKWVIDVDFDIIAASIDKSKKLPKGTTKTMWLLKGKEASIKGKRAHYFGEIYAFHRNIKPSTGYEIAIKKYIDSLPIHIIPIFTELIVYDKEYKISGTIDLVLYNLNDNSVIFADYKTNEVLDKNYKNKKLLPPFDFIKDSPIGKYILQLNIYKHIFEKNTGIAVSDMELVHITDKGMYNIIKMPDISWKIEEVLKYGN